MKTNVEDKSKCRKDKRSFQKKLVNMKEGLLLTSQPGIQALTTKRKPLDSVSFATGNS